ncbi:MAG: DUF4349 domain-containing protein [Formosimonas sp.]
MRLYRPLILSALTLSILAACGKAEHKASAPAAESAPSPAAAAAAPAEKAAANADVTSANKTEQITSTASTSVDPERKFIRTAQAKFAVKDVYQSALAIEDAVAANDGFVTQNHINAEPERNEHYAKGDGKIIDITEYRVAGTLTVRVPSAKTQDFLRAIANQIEFLDQRNFEARDAQFDILRQKIITNTASTNFERGDSKVSEKEFADQVAYATITLNIYQPNTVRKAEYADLNAAVLENRPSFFQRLGQSLATGWYAILDIILLGANIWPLWIALGLAWWAQRRWFKSKNNG